MFRRLMITIVFFAAIINSGLDHSAEMISQGEVCWPLHYSGITLGITNDSQLRRLLGNGVYRRSEGDTGGRYFVDKKRQASLHVVMYTDSVVGELTLLQGLDPSIKKHELPRAVSEFFDPKEGFGNWHQLHLGVTKDEVIKNLGNPAQKINDDVWKYITSCSCEIQEYFTMFFRNGYLFKVVLYSPTG